MSSSTNLPHNAAYFFADASLCLAPYRASRAAFAAALAVLNVALPFPVLGLGSPIATRGVYSCCGFTSLFITASAFFLFLLLMAKKSGRQSIVFIALFLGLFSSVIPSYDLVAEPF